MPTGPEYTPQNPLDILHRFQKAINPAVPTDDFISAPVKFNAEDEQFNRYKASDYAGELGFVPGRNNEELYGQRQTVGNTLWKGLQGAWELGANQFVDGFKGWGRMFDAITSKDWSKLYDQGDMEELNKKQQDVFNNYAIFQTEASKNSLINKQFFGNLLQQSGFSLGTIGQVVAEEALVQLAASALAATGAGAPAGLALDAAEQVKAVKTVAETAELIEKMGDLYKAPSFMRKVFQRALPGVAETADAFKKASGLYDMAKVGFGTIYRTAREANMAMTEARMESANTYGQMKGDLINQFVKDNGRGPNSTEMDKIEDYTRKAASTNFLSNTAIIGIANRLEFDNILKGFSPSIAAEREAGKGLMDITGVLKEGEGAGTRATQVFDKSFKGVAEAGRAFGTKGALKAAGKLALNHLGHIELVEGIQENLQDISDQSSRDYYTKLYGGKAADWASSIKEGFKQENNLQGANTFLQGALTGIVTFPVNWAVGKIQNRGRGAAIKAKKSELINQASQLNAYLRNPENLINEHVARVNLQKEASQGMKDAVNNNDQFTFQNLKDTAFYKMINTAVDTGRFGLLRDRLMDYAQNLSEDEFKKAFPGMDTKGNLQGAVQDLVERAHEINQDLATLKERFRDPFDPTKFKVGTPEHDNEFIRQKAFHDTLEELAYNKYAVRRAKERYQSILNDVASDKEMAGEAFNAFNDLTSRDKLVQKQKIREAIEAVNISIDETEKAKAQKHLDLLTKWYDSTDELLSESKIHNGYDAFKNYLKEATKDAGLTSAITKDTVDRNFLKLMDIIKLQDKAAQHIENVNFLANPRGFNKYSKAAEEGMTAFLKAKQEEEIEKAAETNPEVNTGTEATPKVEETPKEGLASTVERLSKKYGAVIKIEDGKPEVTDKEGNVLPRDTELAIRQELSATGLRGANKQATPEEQQEMMGTLEKEIDDYNSLVDVDDLFDIESTFKEIARTNPELAERATQLAIKTYAKIKHLLYESDKKELIKIIEDKLADIYPDGLHDVEFVEKLAANYSHWLYLVEEKAEDVNGDMWTERKVLQAVQDAIDAHYEYVTKLFTSKVIEEKHEEFDKKIEQLEKQKEQSLLRKQSSINHEGIELLKSIESGSKPAFISKNLERIAKDNNIEVTDKSTPDDIINALKAKLGDSQLIEEDEEKLEKEYNDKIQAIIAERDKWDEDLERKRKTLRPQKEFYGKPKRIHFEGAEGEEQLMKKLTEAKTLKDFNELVKTLPDEFKIKNASYIQGRIAEFKDNTWAKKKKSLSPISIDNKEGKGKKTFYYGINDNVISIYTARGTELTPLSDRYDEIVEAVLTRTSILRSLSRDKHIQLFASAMQVQEGSEAALDSFVSDLLDVMGIAPSRELAQRISKFIPPLQHDEGKLAEEMQKENEQRFIEKIAPIFDSILLDPDVYDKEGKLVWSRVIDKIRNNESINNEFTKDNLELLLKSLDNEETRKKFISQRPVEGTNPESSTPSLLEQERRNQEVTQDSIVESAIEAIRKQKETEEHTYSRRYSQRQTTGKEHDEMKGGIPKVIGDKEVKRRYNIKRWISNNFTKLDLHLEIVKDDESTIKKYDLAMPDDYYSFKDNHHDYLGVIGVLVDKDGNALKFNDKGEPDEGGKGAFFSLPSYYNDKKGTHEQKEGTEYFKPILGMSWSAFKEYMIKNKKTYRAKITEVSHGSVVVDYTRGTDIPTRQVVSGKPFTFMVTDSTSLTNPLGQNVGGLKSGSTYMFVEGNGYPISVNMMTFEESGLLEPTMNVIKQFITPNNGVSLAEMKLMRTYLKQLILSNETFSELSIALNRNTDDGEFLIQGIPITDLDVIRKFLADRRLQIKSRVIGENRFTLYKGIGDPIKTQRYVDFLVDYSRTKLVVDEDRNPLVLNRFLLFDEPTDVTPKVEGQEVSEEIPKEQPKKEEETKKEETVFEKAKRIAAEKRKGKRPPSKLTGEADKPLERSKSLASDIEPASQRDFDKYLRTFKRSYTGDFSDRAIRNLYNIANSTRWGNWASSGLILYKGAGKGTIYHEAWHEFSQLYLTKEEKDELYQEAKKVFGEDKSRKELEEALAEGYRDYSLSQKEPSTLIGKFFKWIKNAIDRIFGTRDRIESLYKALYNERIQRWTPDMGNIEFGMLSQAIKNADGDNVLNTSDSYMIVRTIDAIMYDYITSQASTVSEAINKKGVVNELYDEAYDQIVDSMGAAMEAAQAGEDAEQNTRIVEDLVKVIENWDAVKKYHSERSRTFNISLENTSSDTADSGIMIRDEDSSQPDTPQDEADKETGHKNYAQEMVESSRISSLDSATKETRALIRGLKLATIEAGKPKIQENRWRFPELVDFSKTWNQIANTLAGSIDTKEMLERLELKKSRFPELDELLRVLPKPTETLKEYERDQLVKFWGDFNRTYVPIKETVVGIDDNGNPVFKWDEATKGNIDSITRDFKNNFASASPKTKFLEEDKETHNTILSMKVEDGHSEIFNHFSGKLEGEANKMNKVAFLNLLGIQLSEDTINSGAGFNLNIEPRDLNYLLRYVDLLITNKVKITDPIGQLSTNARALGIAVPKGLDRRQENFYLGKRGILNKIIGYEAKFNAAHASLSMRNAEGNLVYGLSLNNYLTIINNILSNTSRYSTFDVIVKNPFMKHLDPENNPYVKNSQLLNAMFYLDKEVDKEDYLKRKKSGNDYIVLQVGNYSGIKYESQSGMASEGDLTTRMYVKDKLIMDINNMFNGACALMRTGDKALEYYMSLSSWSISSNQKVPVNIGEFSRDFSSIEFHRIMLGYLEDEIKRISDFQKPEYKGRLLTEFSKRGGSFNLFRDILSSGLEARLMKEIKSGEDPYKIMYKLDYNSLFQIDVNKFFQKQYERLVRDLDDSRLGDRSRYRWMNPQLLEQARAENSNEQAVLRAFLGNQFIYHVEQSKLLFGDGAFFKDAHKRFPFVSGTGTILMQEEWHDKWHNLRNAKLKIPPDMHYTAQLYKAHTAIFNDVKFASEYGGLWDRQLRNIVGATEEEIRSILNSYGYLTKEQEKENTLLTERLEKEKAEGKTEGYLRDEDEQNRHVAKLSDEGDAQGWITMPFYRYMKMCQGKWYDKHEAIYEKVMRAEEVSPEEMFYFMPIKAQYGGPLDIDGVYAPAYHKFSLMPLLPAMIKGTHLESINKRMIDQNIAYGLFKSGSKITEYTEDGKFNDNFYDNYDKTTRSYNGRDELPQDYQFTKNTIFLQFLKEQVNIAPESHNEVIFASQMRKLVLMNLFSNGKFINEKNLEGSPDLNALANKYMSTVRELTNYEKNKLFQELTITQKDGKYEIGDMAKFAERLNKEAGKRDYNDNVLEFIDYDKTTKKFKNPLDASVNAGQIQSMIMSIINNRVVRQLISGDMMVQGSSSGMERNSGKFTNPTKAQLAQYGTNGLRFYHMKDGKVLSMQVKIPLSGHFLKLLNREDVKLKAEINKVSLLEALNMLIKDEGWMSKNKELVTMIGTRIPVQSLNSMEVMEVAEFLPTYAGDIMIVPSEIVVKAGSDFDIDKIFTFKPVIDDDGNHVKDVDSNDERGKQGRQNSLIDTMKEIILHPANFKLLISPNETDQVKPIAMEIKDKTSKKPWLKSKSDEFTGTDMYTYKTQLEKFQSGLVGKRTLGIAAVNNTFLQLFMFGGLRAMPKYREEEREYDDETREVTSTYMTDVDTFVNLADRDEHGGYNMSSLLDENKILKSKFTEQMINAYVDVLKDDFIFYANAGLDIAGVMFYLKCLGVGTPKIFYFMNHPSIRAWVEQENIRKSKIVNKVLKEDEDTLNATINAMIKGKWVNGVNVPGVFTNDLLRKYARTDVAAVNMILEARELKGAKLREHIARFAETKKDTLFTAPEFKRRVGLDSSDIDPLEQLLVLNELANMKTQGEIFRKAESSLNFDTNKSANQFDAQIKLNTYDKVSDEVNGYALFNKDALEKIRDQSVISSFNVQKMIIDIMEKVFPVTGDTEFVKRAVDLLENPKVLFKSQATKDRVLRSYRNDIITFILTNYADAPDGNGTLGNYVHSRKNMFRTMASRLFELKGKYKDEVVKYDFFNNLSLNPSKKNLGTITDKIPSDIKNIELFRPDNSVPAQNSAIEQWRRLATEGPKELQDFFKDLAIFTYFQSGLTKSNISFTDLIPVTPDDIIVKYLRESIEKFQADVEKRGMNSVLDGYTDLFMRENKVFNPFKQEDDYRYKDYRRGTDTPPVTPTKPTGPAPEGGTPTTPKSTTGFQGYKSGYKNTGKGTPQGDGKDKAMRAVANSAIVELAHNNASSSKTSLAELGLPKEGDKVIMLARNGELNGKPLREETKEQIRQANLDGAEFVVGDMPGVDSQFIDYLKEIGAKFTIYHTGSNPRVQVAEQATDTSAVEIKEGRGEVYFLARNNVKTPVTSENIEQVGTIYWNGVRKITKEQAKEWLSAKKAREEGVSSSFIPTREVHEAFNQNPELSKIGTEQEYNSYLSGVFPQSKVQDVVWHGTDTRFEEFDPSKRGENTGKSISGQSFDSEHAFFFTSNRNVAFNYAILRRQEELKVIVHLIEVVSSTLNRGTGTIRRDGREMPLSEYVRNSYAELLKLAPEVGQRAEQWRKEGLDAEARFKKMREVYHEYYNKYKDLIEGGAISNARRFYNDIEESLHRLEAQKDSILAGKYNNISTHGDKYSFNTTGTGYDMFTISADGTIHYGLQTIYPELKSLSGKKITNLSPAEFDSLVKAIKQTITVGRQKVEDDIKRGSFTPQNILAKVNMTNPVEKDFEGRPFVEQIDNDRGARQEVTDMVIKAKQEGNDGAIIKNIADPEVGDAYAVFEPNQVHILGSKKDVEGFRSWKGGGKAQEDRSIPTQLPVIKSATVFSSTGLSEISKQEAFSKGEQMLKQGVKRVVTSLSQEENAGVAANVANAQVITHGLLSKWEIGKGDEKNLVNNPDEVPEGGEAFNDFLKRAVQAKLELSNLLEPGDVIMADPSVMRLWKAYDDNGGWNEGAIKQYLSSEAEDGNFALQRGDIEQARNSVIEKLNSGLFDKMLQDQGLSRDALLEAARESQDMNELLDLDKMICQL